MPVRWTSRKVLRGAWQYVLFVVSGSSRVVMKDFRSAPCATRGILLRRRSWTFCGVAFSELCLGAEFGDVVVGQRCGGIHDCVEVRLAAGEVFGHLCAGALATVDVVDDLSRVYAPVLADLVET